MKIKLEKNSLLKIDLNYHPWIEKVDSFQNVLNQEKFLLSLYNIVGAHDYRAFCRVLMYNGFFSKSGYF